MKEKIRKNRIYERNEKMIEIRRTYFFFLIMYLIRPYRNTSKERNKFGLVNIRMPCLQHMIYIEFH